MIVKYTRLSNNEENKFKHDSESATEGIGVAVAIWDLSDTSKFVIVVRNLLQVQVWIELIESQNMIRY